MGMGLERNFILEMREGEEGVLVKSSDLAAVVFETGSVILDFGKSFTFVSVDDQVPTLKEYRKRLFLPWNRVVHWGLKMEYGVYFVYVEYEGALHTNNQGQFRTYIGEVRFQDIDQAKGLVDKLNRALHEVKSYAGIR